MSSREPTPEPEETRTDEPPERSQGASNRAKLSIFMIGVVFISTLICMCLVIFAIVSV